MPTLRLTHDEADTVYQALWEACRRDGAQAAYHAQAGDTDPLAADDAYAYAVQAARAARIAGKL